MTLVVMISRANVYGVRGQVGLALSLAINHFNEVFAASFNIDQNSFKDFSMFAAFCKT